jgi:hypothetical protein
MAMTNAEYQARWREKNIRERRAAQRLANLLVVKNLTKAHIEEAAGLVRWFMMTRENCRIFAKEFRKISERTSEFKKENGQFWADQEIVWRDLWLREHPGRTAAEYNRLSDSEEVWAWRRAIGEADFEAERQDWQREHGGEEYPEMYGCGMTGREATDCQRWRRQRARKAQREAKKQANNKPRANGR